MNLKTGLVHMGKLSIEAELHHGILKRFPNIHCKIHVNTHHGLLIFSQGLEAIGVREVVKSFNTR